MCPRLSLEKHRRSSVDGSCCPFCPRLLLLPLQRWLQLNLSFVVPFGRVLSLSCVLSTGRDRAYVHWHWHVLIQLCVRRLRATLDDSFDDIVTTVHCGDLCRCTAAGAPEVMTAEEMTLTSALRLRWSAFKNSYAQCVCWRRVDKCSEKSICNILRWDALPDTWPEWRSQWLESKLKLK